MECCEVRIAQAFRLFQPFEGQTGLPLDWHSDLLGRLEFRREFLRGVLADRRKEITIDPPEMTLDTLFRSNRFDSINCFGVALIEGLRTVQPARLRESFESVVGLGCQVGACARCHAACDPPPIQYGDL